MHKTLAIFNNCTPVTREDDPQEAPRFKQYRGADFGQEVLTRGLTSIKLTCKSDDCKHGKTFEMPATDQVFALHTFGRRGTEMPKWCPGCRIDRPQSPVLEFPQKMSTDVGSCDGRLAFECASAW